MGKSIAKRNGTLVTFVLDETGSMQSIKDDTIGGFNAWLEKLQNSGEDFSVTLVKFDSSRIQKVCIDTPISKVDHLTDKTYQPGAATPLVDACVKSIKATEPKVNGQNVLFVIQTDGYENASTEYTYSDLALLVKEKEAEGWTFVFIGAGIDAFDQAAQMGIAASHTASYGRGQSAKAFGAVADCSVNYAMSGGTSSAASFTHAQRTAMSGDNSGGLGLNPIGSSPGNVTSAARRVKRNPKKNRPMVDDFTL